MTADLDAIMERRRDDAASVDTCVRCETPFGDLSRVTVDLAAFLGTDRARDALRRVSQRGRARDGGGSDRGPHGARARDPAPVLPLDLDGAALRSLRALCGTDYAARIVWSRWGVTVAIVGIAGTVAQSTAATIADAVAGPR